MPGLILFRRRWTIGSDDFVYSSIGETGLRIAWLVTLIVVFSHNHGSFSCLHGNSLEAFFIGTIVITSVSLINAIALFFNSKKGTIWYERPRRFVRYFIYTKFLLLLPEVVWECYSTYVAFGYSYDCDQVAVWTVKVCVLFSWAIGVFMFVMILLVFDPMGSRNQRYSVACNMTNSGKEHVSVESLSAQKVWETRCRFLCCCIACSPDTKQAFSDVSKLVADFFHDVDLVPTDIAAGLILVQKQQALSSPQLHAVVVDGSDQGNASRSDDPGSSPWMAQPKEWMTINNMAHYMKYAMGSYGWPFYIYEHLGTGLCRLSPACKCCPCLRLPDGVNKDNPCHCNTAAIKKLSGASDDDLIYVTFHDKFKEIPFYVAIDRETKAVIVSIRGTLSLQDALTDVSARGAPLDIPGIENSSCHCAMLDCATYIKEQIETLGLLETAFSHFHGDADLVITGHSLGAGVASILSVLLVQSYPNLRCFAFSPPGGLMSPNASRSTQDYICSVVVGKDLVPRLGMYTLADLKVKMLRAIVESWEPKYRILAAGFLRMLCCLQPQDDDPARSALVREREGSTNTDYKILEDSLKKAETQVEEILKTEWPLHPAGQILHILDVNDDDSCCGEAKYCALWTGPESFDKIVISHRMIMDHFPNAVNNALEQLKTRNYTPRARHISQHHVQCDDA